MVTAGTGGSVVVVADAVVEGAGVPSGLAVQAHRDSNRVSVKNNDSSRFIRIFLSVTQGFDTSISIFDPNCKRGVVRFPLTFPIFYSTMQKRWVVHCFGLPQEGEQSDHPNRYDILN